MEVVAIADSDMIATGTAEALTDGMLLALLSSSLTVIGFKPGEFCVSVA